MTASPATSAPLFTDHRGTARPPRTDAERRMAASQAEAQGALAANACPTCGGPVALNLSITGWVQCQQFGAVGFRLDSARPACSWQGFAR